jgi:hypothetical protein
LATSLLTIAIAACPDNSTHSTEKQFFERHLSDQHKVFRTLEPDEQVKIYIAAQRRHPPDVAFCRDLAEASGAAAIPSLLRALSEVESGYEKVAILQGLECITRRNPAACDEDLFVLARRAAASVQGDVLRAEAEEAVSKMPCAGGHNGRDSAP